MFGIGLPEMILILALALIVVGPDKLPDLARSLAKGLLELKKTAEGLKDSLSEEGNPFDDIRPDLEDAAKSLKNNLLDTPPYNRGNAREVAGVYSPEENAAMAYKELQKQTGVAPVAGDNKEERTVETDPQTTEQDVKKVEESTPKIELPMQQNKTQDGK